MQDEIEIRRTTLASFGSAIQTYRTAVSTRIAAGLLTFIGAGLAFLASFFIFCWPLLSRISSRAYATR